MQLSLKTSVVEKLFNINVLKTVVQTNFCLDFLIITNRPKQLLMKC